MIKLSYFVGFMQKKNWQKWRSQTGLYNRSDLIRDGWGLSYLRKWRVA